MIEHLSYSSISLWNQCPRAWYAQYILGYRQPDNYALLFGKAAHAAIEDSWVSGRPVWVLFVEKLHDEWGKTTGIPEKLMIELAVLGNTLFSDPSVIDELASVRPLSPKWIERRIEFTVPDVPVPVIGFIDVVCDDGVPLDIKTSQWDWGEDRAQSETQPLFYLHALDRIGMMDHGGRFRHLVIVKDDIVPRAYTIESVHQDYTSKVIKTVQTAWDGISHELWKTITPQNHNESCRCFELFPNI